MGMGKIKERERESGVDRELRVLLNCQDAVAGDELARPRGKQGRQQFIVVAG